MHFEIYFFFNSKFMLVMLIYFFFNSKFMLVMLKMISERIESPTGFLKWQLNKLFTSDNFKKASWAYHQLNITIYGK